MHFNPQSEKISRHVNNLRWYKTYVRQHRKHPSRFILLRAWFDDVWLFSLIFLCSLNNKSVHFPRKEKKNFAPVVFLHFSHRWKVVGIMWQYFFLFYPNKHFISFSSSCNIFSKNTFWQIKFFSRLDRCCLKYKMTACFLPRYHLNMC